MDDPENWANEAAVVFNIYIVQADDGVALSADHIADSNIGFHEWNSYLRSSPQYFSPSASPTPSISPSSNGSELDLSTQPQPSDTLHYQQSLHPLSAFDGLSLTDDPRLSDNRGLDNGSSSSSASSFGILSPDPFNSPHFSDSSWVDGRHLSTNNSPDIRHSGGLQSPASSFVYTSSSDEFLGNPEQNYSPGSPSSYYSASDYNASRSEGSLPQSPLVTNDSSEFHSSFENIFSPQGLLLRPPARFPTQSPEPDNHSPRIVPYSNFQSENIFSPQGLLLRPPARFPTQSPEPDNYSPQMIPYSDVQSHAREYLSPLFGGPSPPEFVEGSSSQGQRANIFDDLGDLFEGQQQRHIAPSLLETEQEEAQRDEEGDSVVFKHQVSTPAGFAASEKKRKCPHKWLCDVCGRGFTRKHSRETHLSAHRGKLTKHCEFCHKNLAGSLNRHKSTCKKNPNRVNPKKSPKKS